MGNTYGLTGGEVKHCNRCSEVRSVDSFYKNKSTKDGFGYWCKLCVKETSKRYYINNIDTYRLWRINNRDTIRRLSSENYIRRKNNGKARECSLKYDKKNPHVRLAVNRVNKAILSGKLTREPCVVCGETRVVGHHEDYSRPLDVTWLCRIHHRIRHDELNSVVEEN